MAIAVDAMGGDSPLSVQVEAAVGAVNDFGIDVVLVGAFEQIEGNAEAPQLRFRQIYASLIPLKRWK